ncbi:uncharacterized protein EHS24_007586 [Apiotrichum porosum]|uniref:Uncharacterized protein n=1 Tax=Apiotrichum porosum TaxID=105984 RepID=A0A427XUT8_9TREE|nr:uncharacterized protein EHS24_007586 [Apiotrichum porosum]RSH82602.1 hypothetical protein EHS24_007586 [Apiotrichum porosum]
MKTTMWWSVATLSLAMSTVRALTYMGQVYGVTVLSPNSTEPWYTGGYNVIDVQVIQTLICCPPLPEVDWILHNPDSSLLASDLLLNGGDNFTPPTNPDISTAKPGNGYVLVVALKGNASAIFGQSDAFQVVDGAVSPNILNNGSDSSAVTSTLADNATTTTASTPTDTPTPTAGGSSVFGSGSGAGSSMGSVSSTQHPESLSTTTGSVPTTGGTSQPVSNATATGTATAKPSGAAGMGMRVSGAGVAVALLVLVIM